MSQVINFIKLDFNRSNNVTIPTIEWDQGSRFVRVQLQNNNQSVDITGSQVVITVIRNDLEEIIESCNILNAKDGLIEFEISKAMVARQGDMLCQLKLSDNDSLLSSQLFKVSVNNTLMVSLEESRSDMDVLIHALGEVQDIDNRFNKTNYKIDENYQKVNTQLSHLETTTEGFVNIKSYAHLVVDNDWSDALIQALNEHPNIYIPAGEYEISKTIKIINNKRIVGGADIYSTSIISKLQSGTLFDITYSAYGSSSISNLFIENKGGETVNGVVLNDNEVSGRTPFGFFGNNLDIRGFYHNLYLRGMCTYTTFTRCFFSKAKKLNLYVVSGFVNTFDKCRFSSSESGVSVRVRAGEQNFAHCAFEGAAKGLDITPNGGKVGIDGCFFEYLGDESSTLLNVNSPNDNFTALNVLNVRNTHFYGGDVSIYLNGVKHANLDGNSLREVKDRNVVYPTNNPNASLWVFNGNLYDVAINTDASYIVGDDLPTKITVSNTLPRADESQNGRFFIFETGTYQELRVCMKYPAGNYGWAKVFTTESASVIDI